MNGKMQYDAGNLKFTVRKKRTICGIWAVFLTAPIAAFLDMYLRNRLAEYQIARIQAMFSSGSETDYLTKMLHSLWRQNKLIGKSKSDVTGILPAFKRGSGSKSTFKTAKYFPAGVCSMIT